MHYAELESLPRWVQAFIWGILIGLIIGLVFYILDNSPYAFSLSEHYICLAIIVGLIVGAIFTGGAIYAGLEKIAKTLEKQK